ncbi:MAG: hypothetical protein KJ907_14280 [Actinobacteria bacterium]|nr:hypothetical protein [Actinomycetota bacterium]
MKDKLLRAWALLSWLTFVFLLIDFILISIRPTHAMIIRNVSFISDWRFFIGLWVLLVLSIILIDRISQNRASDAGCPTVSKALFRVIGYLNLALCSIGLFLSLVFLEYTVMESFFITLFFVMWVILFMILLRRFLQKRRKSMSGITPKACDQGSPKVSKSAYGAFAAFIEAMPLPFLILILSILLLIGGVYIPVISECYIDYQPDRIDLRYFEQATGNNGIGMIFIGSVLSRGRIMIQIKFLENCSYFTEDKELREKAERISSGLVYYLEGMKFEEKGEKQQASQCYYETVNSVRGSDLHDSENAYLFIEHMKEVIREMWNNDDDVSSADRMTVSREIAKFLLGYSSDALFLYWRSWNAARDGDATLAQERIKELVELDNSWAHFINCDPTMLKD